MKNTRNKKRILLISLLLSACMSLTACGSSVSMDDYNSLKDELKELKAENKELLKELEELKGSDVPANVGGGSSTSSDKKDSESGNSDFIVETSGICGADLKWEYGRGKLKIKGKGDMSDYECVKLDSGKYGTTAPWMDLSDKIAYVEIENGVTSIGKYAFSKLHNLSKISIPDTISVIHDNAFYETYNLHEIQLPSSLTKVGEYAFCTSNTTAEAAAEATEQYIEDGELMYIVEKKIWKYIIGSDVTLYYKGNKYEKNDELCDALSNAGVDVPYNTLTHSVKACDYTLDMGEIVEEYYY